MRIEYALMTHVGLPPSLPITKSYAILVVSKRVENPSSAKSVMQDG